MDDTATTETSHQMPLPQVPVPQMPVPWSAYDADTCSVARTVEVLGDRWTFLVLREIFNGVRRFDDITDHISISRSVLTDRLAKLIEFGLVERRPYREPGDRQRYEYRLTDMGWDLQTVLIALMGFGDRWRVTPDGPPVLVEHRGCGEPVAAELRCADGHRIDDRRELVLRPGPGARFQEETA